jgi:alkylated DNA nucleotide flippase Atl1
MKGDVLRIVAGVPAGRVVTFADTGAHLDVAPRHVACILATLDPLEAGRRRR